MRGEPDLGFTLPRADELPPLPELSLLKRAYVDPRLRSRMPLRAGFWLARLRAEMLWRASSGGRAEVAEEMRFLLERSPRAGEVSEIARRFALQNARRSELEWRPRLGRHIPLEGLDHLRAAHAEGRGVLLHFMHQGPYVHIATGLGARGIDFWAPIADYFFETPVPGLVGHKDRTHLMCLLEGCKPFPASGTFEIVRQLFASGEIVALASDLPGSLPASFLGRQVLVSSGSARLAIAGGVPIVCLTWHPRRGDRVPIMRLHPSIDAREFSDPISLESAILAIHEPAVLAWPESLERPRMRWNLAEAAST